MTTNQNQKTLPAIAAAMKFHLAKEHMRRIDFDDEGGLTIYHLYPSLAEWVGRALPDKINPRSHDVDMMKGPVVAGITSTIKERPKDFVLANRGATIIAETLRFDPTRNEVEIIISDAEEQGVADGGTSDAVISMIQQEVIDAIAPGKTFQELNKEDLPSYLTEARFHVEVIVGLKDRERIGELARGRNTSRQVKSWSIASFKGAFDWIEEILESDNSSFKGRVGYEENAGKEVNVLEVLSIMTLFTKEWDDKGGRLKRGAPTVAYSSKGRMDTRFQDPNLASNYEALSLILTDILELHDYVYVEFDKAYKDAFGAGSKPGSRRGIDSKKEVILPLTGVSSRLDISAGYIFPLLASLRALIGYDDHGKAYWLVQPKEFFDKYGAELVSVLIEQIESQGNNPQSAGKSRPVYTSVHDRAKLLLSDERLAVA